MHLTISKYKISFQNLEYKSYKDDNYSTISFCIDNIIYEIVDNYMLGDRLLQSGIKDKIGLSKDVPLHEGTFYLLPKEIEIEKI